MADGKIQFEGMDGETPESFVKSDTDYGSWPAEDRTEAGAAQEYIKMLKETFPGDEAQRLNAMLATQVDEAGHGLGDSRIFVKAVSRAAKQFEDLLRKRVGGEREDGGPQLKFNMPVTSHADRLALQREARTILDKELLNARSEFIRRSGRSLPGWWR